MRRPESQFRITGLIQATPNNLDALFQKMSLTCGSLSFSDQQAHFRDRKFSRPTRIGSMCMWHSSQTGVCS